MSIPRQTHALPTPATDAALANRLERQLYFAIKELEYEPRGRTGNRKFAASQSARSSKGTLIAQVPEQEWLWRTPAPAPPPEDTLGRNLFDLFRNSASGAMLGASVFEPAKSTQ